MSKDKSPDNVIHKTDTSLPLGAGNVIHETIIEKDGKTYSGCGDTEDEANKNAGEKYSNGNYDKTIFED